MKKKKSSRPVLSTSEGIIKELEETLELIKSGEIDRLEAKERFSATKQAIIIKHHEIQAKYIQAYAEKTPKQILDYSSTDDYSESLGGGQ